VRGISDAFVREITNAFVAEASKLQKNNTKYIQRGILVENVGFVSMNVNSLIAV
jgi:hypothetical protein